MALRRSWVRIPLGPPTIEYDAVAEVVSHPPENREGENPMRQPRIAAPNKAELGCCRYELTSISGEPK